MTTHSQIPKIALVVPCYNEEAMISITIKKLTQLLREHIDSGLISPESFAVFVNDGSKDRTWEVLIENKNPLIRALKLSNNVGHQHALLAGLTYVTNQVDCCISLDADLQDDISVIPDMIRDYTKGTHIVYGVRASRGTDKAMKKGTALLFYKLLERMGVDVVYNHADYRLLSNKVLVELQKYKEVNLFLRGLFPLMGFTSSTVYYDRLKREAGETKYPFKKMLNLAINGITSFSDYPLRLITRIGLIIFLGSLVTSIWVFIVMIRGKNVPGWASITLPMYFLGGIQLLVLGIMGEYLGKIYRETKGRPRFHIEEEVS
jgi:glycosyltransferase involved in cell wall biosynthesis